MVATSISIASPAVVAAVAALSAVTAGTAAVSARVVASFKTWRTEG
eukprot:CAMPEP_0182558222 /NCGR_PEP_ID=MMETSP1324-20130603/1856_1 /TAXON_ID=236786 /ORGANISM="Florenciella sp., Strain RCC1587" /LENGTH=45 /DNA_ID= /DNA_START= /DNA_END= /DNA_ORIENTATION=